MGSYSRTFQVISSNILSTYRRIDKTTMGEVNCKDQKTESECIKHSEDSCYHWPCKSKCKWTGSDCKDNDRDDERQAGPVNGLPVEILNLVAAAYDKLDKQQD